MRRGIDFSVGAGVLGLAVSGVFAVPARAAESDISFSKVVFNGGDPIVAGTTNLVEVPLTYTVKSSVTLTDWKVSAYWGTLGVDEIAFGDWWTDADCTKSVSGGVTTRKCSGTAWFYPKTLGLVNSAATAWKTVGTGIKKNGTFDDDKLSATVSLKRYAKLTVNVTPEPVVAGKTVTVTGKITRANWTRHRYDGNARSSVKLQFKAAGGTSYTTVKTVTSSSMGALKATATATVDGSWRWSYGGNSTTGSQTSAGDHVDVR